MTPGSAQNLLTSNKMYNSTPTSVNSLKLKNNNNQTVLRKQNQRKQNVLVNLGTPYTGVVHHN